MRTFIDLPDIGQLEQLNLPEGRRYRTPNGDVYKSVTTWLGEVSKADLSEWIAAVGEEEAERVSTRAKNRGTRIHQLIEDYLKGMNPKPSMFDKPMFDPMKPFLDTIEEVFLLEQRMWSDEIKMAGTVDCIGKIRGKLCVIDFKTSKGIKYKDEIDSYFLQTACYAIMFFERYGLRPTHSVILMGTDFDKPQVFVDKLEPWILKVKELVG